MKSDALASVGHRNDAQKEYVAQAIEFALQIHIPTTDLGDLNTLRVAHGANTAAQPAPFQIANISGQSESKLTWSALMQILTLRPTQNSLWLCPDRP